MSLNMNPNQTALQGYMNNPGYALTFGANGTINNAGLTPLQRFQADPGYQWQQDEAMRNVKAAMANKGLVNSGVGLNALMRTSQGLANQQYQSYLDRVDKNYNQYMTNVAGVMNNGANKDLATLEAQQGDNLASLNANQGTAGLSAYTNTGAGMAGLSMEAGAALAQLNQAKIASQNGQTASTLGSALGLVGSGGQVGTNLPTQGLPYGTGSTGGGGGSGGGGGGGSSGSYGSGSSTGSDWLVDPTQYGLAGYPAGYQTSTGGTGSSGYDMFGIAYDDPYYSQKRQQAEAGISAYFPSGMPGAGSAERGAYDRAVWAVSQGLGDWGNQFGVTNAG